MVSPAYAGMIPFAEVYALWKAREPRIRGDDPNYISESGKSIT